MENIKLRFLSPNDKKNIHHTSLKILEEVGVKVAQERLNPKTQGRYPDNLISSSKKVNFSSGG